MAQKFYVRRDGSFCGSLVDTEQADAGPEYADAIEVPDCPVDARQTWDFDSKKFSDPPPPVFELPRAFLYHRMTEDEATAFQAAMEDATAKVKGGFDSSLHLDSESDLFAALRTKLSVLFGDERAAEILAPPY